MVYNGLPVQPYSVRVIDVGVEGGVRVSIGRCSVRAVRGVDGRPVDDGRR